MSTKNIIKFGVLSIVILAIAYLYGALTAGGFNPANWDVETRKTLSSNIPICIMLAAFYLFYIQED